MSRMGPPRSQPTQANQDPRYQNPQSRNQQPTAGHVHASQYEQYQEFPPHPSVRVPPNVKLNPRYVPAGVGIAPPPVRYDSQRRQQPLPGTGVLVQDFKFPSVPPIPETSPGRVRQDHSQSPGRKYNMHDSYMSSMVDDYGTPGTTPGSRSRGFPTPRRYSGSVYAESEALGADERYDETVPSPGQSRPSSPGESPQIVRQASLGKRAKPAMTTIRNRNSHLDHDIPENATAPTPTSRNATMDALSAAVAAGMSTNPVQPRPETPGSRSYTPVRMPFDTSPPASPSYDREFLQTPKSPNTVVSSRLLDQTPGSGHSHKSSNALLGLGIGQPAMSNKIPPGRRPPKLDMDAVRDAENRGSTTSLADLIKRATRLASNLDRGRTASRLGMLDMWGSNEKLGGNNRHSTMSDMISAFPAPAVGGTPTRGNDWPLVGEKGGAYASTTDLSKHLTTKRRRKCCGLSLPVFFSILVVVTILVAAAVLIPIFLILVPKQRANSNSNSLSDCSSSHPCQNGGVSIVSEDACVCVCSNGFTGSQCETAGDAQDCTTTTFNDGSTQYKNATVGDSVKSPLSDAPTRFDIPLNASTILSLFSSNNLSCSSENSLLDFNSSSAGTATKAKRFVILPGLEPTRAPEVTKRAQPLADLQLERRQDGVTVGTSNGIVFQATSATSLGAISTPSASVGAGVSTVTSVGGTGNAAPSATGSVNGTSGAGGSNSTSSTTPVTDRELEFARAVVLFVLQESRTVSVAVHAQQQLVSFFLNQTEDTNTTAAVAVGLGNLHLTADFDAFSITTGDGQVIGGQTGS